MSCFEDIKDSSEWNRESRADAQSLFLALSRIPFIAALIITRDILAYTKQLSIKLQGRYLDIVKAYEQISIVQTALKNAREDIDTFHSGMYTKVKQVASKVNINESRLRTVGRQQHRNNIPATAESEYYKRTLTIPMLDHLITEMKERFQFDTSCIFNQVRLLLPSELVKSTETTTLTQKDIPDLIRLYGDDIPSVPSLDSELHFWQTKWRSTRC